VIVRPVILTDGPKTNAYRALVDPRGWTCGFISRADVADFLVKQIDDDAFLQNWPAGVSFDPRHQRRTLSGGKLVVAVTSTTARPSCPNSLESLAVQTGLCRMRTESLAALSPRAGKRFSGARDERRQTVSERFSFFTETANRQMHPHQTTENRGCSAETRKS
jgi:hypothetical protein